MKHPASSLLAAGIMMATIHAHAQDTYHVGVDRILTPKKIQEGIQALKKGDQPADITLTLTAGTDEDGNYVIRETNPSVHADVLWKPVENGKDALKHIYEAFSSAQTADIYNYDEYILVDAKLKLLPKGGDGGNGEQNEIIKPSAASIVSIDIKWSEEPTIIMEKNEEREYRYFRVPTPPYLNTPARKRGFVVHPMRPTKSEVDALFPGVTNDRTEETAKLNWDANLIDVFVKGQEDGEPLTPWYQMPPESLEEAIEFTAVIKVNAPCEFTIIVVGPAPYKPQDSIKGKAIPLQITDPAFNDDAASRAVKADAHYVFKASGANAQACEVKTTAASTGDYDNDLYWMITKIDEVIPTPMADWGRNATFTYETPPKNNSAFAARYKITLTHHLLAGEKDEREFRIFYDPMARNIHNQTRVFDEVLPHYNDVYHPNWFYYWNQGGVIPNLKLFLYGGNRGTVNGAFRFGTLYIYDYAYNKGVGDARIPIWDYQNIKRKVGFNSTLPDDDPRRIIQGVAAVCSHEIKHRNLSLEIKSGAVDLDGDGTPDTYETNDYPNTEVGPTDTFGIHLNYDPIENQDTVKKYQQAGDNEYLARRAEENGYGGLDFDKDYRENGYVYQRDILDRTNFDPLTPQPTE